LRLAVLSAGVQDRFLLNSKVRQLVARNAKQGHSVDFFVELVRPGEQEGGLGRGGGKSMASGSASALPSVEAAAASGGGVEAGGDKQLEKQLRERLEEAGGKLAHFSSIPAWRIDESYLPDPQCKECRRILGVGLCGLQR
jgi:hypothetical protein